MGPNTIWVLIPLTAIICMFGMPIYFTFKKQIAEINAKAKNNVDAEVLAELNALKHQISELRDTTTRYDMSFDTALQRIESRVSHVEGQVNAKPEEKIYSGRVA